MMSFSMKVVRRKISGLINDFSSLMNEERLTERLFVDSWSDFAHLGG